MSMGPWVSYRAGIYLAYWGVSNCFFYKLSSIYIKLLSVRLSRFLSVTFCLSHYEEWRTVEVGCLPDPTILRLTTLSLSSVSVPLNVCPPSPVAFFKYFKSDFYAIKAKLVNSMSRDMIPSPILPCTLHMQACPYYWLEFQGGLSLPPSISLTRILQPAWQCLLIPA